MLKVLWQNACNRQVYGGKWLQALGWGAGEWLLGFPVEVTVWTEVEKQLWCLSWWMYPTPPGWTLGNDCAGGHPAVPAGVRTRGTHYTLRGRDKMFFIFSFSGSKCYQDRQEKTACKCWDRVHIPGGRAVKEGWESGSTSCLSRTGTSPLWGASWGTHPASRDFLLGISGVIWYLFVAMYTSL